MKSLLRFFPGVAAAVLLCLGCPLSGVAASTNVVVGSPLDRFTPAVVTIAAGDQVIWTWAATFHSTTSGTNGVAGDDNGVPSGLWNSGTITTLPHTFTNTFPVAGNFSYFCQVHYSFGMLGSVIVNSTGIIAPTVSITNPATGALFAAPASVTIQATVTNGSGTVTNVQFLLGSAVLTNETAAPFSAVTNNLPAGDYTLTAIASDDNGATATNSVNISVVTPVPIVISSPSRPSGTNFQFSYTANAGLGYIVQRSTNLLSTNWITLVTNTAAASQVNFSDTNAAASPGFYRVGRLPNP